MFKLQKAVVCLGRTHGKVPEKSLQGLTEVLHQQVARKWGPQSHSSKDNLTTRDLEPQMKWQTHMTPGLQAGEKPRENSGTQAILRLLTYRDLVITATDCSKPPATCNVIRKLSQIP